VPPNVRISRGSGRFPVWDFGRDWGLQRAGHSTTIGTDRFQFHLASSGSFDVSSDGNKAAQPEASVRLGKLSRRRTWMFRLVAIALSCFAATAIVELGLRLTRDPSRVFPYYPGSVGVSYPNEKITPGVSGESYFRANSLGCRGPEYSGQRFGLLTIGGSTTACTQLDDSEAWPQLVMDKVNAQLEDQRALWVINSGIDGLNSRHHIMHAAFLLPQLEHIQYATFYCGINDAGNWLFTKEFDPKYLDSQDNWDNTIAESFRLSRHTPASYPWYKRFEIYKRGATLRNALLRHTNIERGLIVEDDRLNWLEKAQKDRQKGNKSAIPLKKMQTLDIALETYGQNLTRIIELCHKAGVEPIFIAQAVEYLGLTEEQKRRLWVGAVNGGRAYLEERPMQELVDRFNARMAEVARLNHVPFIDLPQRIGLEPGFTYDGCHFNEAGARRVAEIISNFLVTEVLPIEAAAKKPDANAEKNEGDEN